MMHLKNLGIEASVKETENPPNRYEAKILIPGSLKYFEGHFPGNPVLPAFASIEISLALGRDLKLLPDKVNKISNAKFLAVVKPQDHINVLVRTYDTSVDFEWLIDDAGVLKKACELSVVV